MHGVQEAKGPRQEHKRWLGDNIGVDIKEHKRWWVIILVWILQKMCLREGTGLNWPRIESRGGIL